MPCAPCSGLSSSQHYSGVVLGGQQVRAHRGLAIGRTLSGHAVLAGSCVGTTCVSHRASCNLPRCRPCSSFICIFLQNLLAPADPLCNVAASKLEEARRHFAAQR